MNIMRPFCLDGQLVSDIPEYALSLCSPEYENICSTILDTHIYIGSTHKRTDKDARAPTTLSAGTHMDRRQRRIRGRVQAVQLQQRMVVAVLGAAVRVHVVVAVLQPLHVLHVVAAAQAAAAQFAVPHVVQHGQLLLHRFDAVVDVHRLQPVGQRLVLLNCARERGRRERYRLVWRNIVREMYI